MTTIWPLSSPIHPPSCPQEAEEETAPPHHLLHIISQVAKGALRGPQQEILQEYESITQALKTTDPKRAELLEQGYDLVVCTPNITLRVHESIIPCLLAFHETMLKATCYTFIHKVTCLATLNNAISGSPQLCHLRSIEEIFNQYIARVSTPCAQQFLASSPSLAEFQEFHYFHCEEDEANLLDFLMGVAQKAHTGSELQWELKLKATNHIRRQLSKETEEMGKTIAMIHEHISFPQAVIACLKHCASLSNETASMDATTDDLIVFWQGYIVARIREVRHQPKEAQATEEQEALKAKEDLMKDEVEEERLKHKKAQAKLEQKKRRAKALLNTPVQASASSRILEESPASPAERCEEPKVTVHNSSSTDHGRWISVKTPTPSSPSRRTLLPVLTKARGAGVHPRVRRWEEADPRTFVDGPDHRQRYLHMSLPQLEEQRWRHLFPPGMDRWIHCPLFLENYAFPYCLRNREGQECNGYLFLVTTLIKNSSETSVASLGTTNRGEVCHYFVHPPKDLLPKSGSILQHLLTEELQGFSPNDLEFPSQDENPMENTSSLREIPLKGQRFPLLAIAWKGMSLSIHPLEKK